MTRRALSATAVLLALAGQSGGVELSSVGATPGTGFRFVTTRTNDRLGARCAGVGDFNGDGLADFAAGLPFSYYSASRAESGLAEVLLGKSSPSGESTSVHVTLGGSVTGMGLGWSVSSAGDVNADGLPDFAIGAPRSPGGAPGEVGSVYVYTKNTALVSSVNQFTSRQLGFVLNGGEAGSGLGQAIAPLGDFNGDGLDDLVAGAPYATSGGYAFAGRAYVLFGKAVLEDVGVEALEQGTGGLVIASDEPGALLGASVSGIGDINGDGLADLMVGAPGAGTLERPGCGVVYVVLGSANTSPIDLAQVRSGVGGFALVGAELGEEAGLCVAAGGDVDGDGRLDMMIGSSASETGGLDAGRCYVVFGRGDSQEVDLRDIADGTGGFVVRGAAPGDRLGASLSFAGDLNGDGLADLLIGSPGADPVHRTEAGAAYLVFGKASTDPVLVSVPLAADLGITFTGEGILNQAGYSVAGPGDLGGDGTPDFLIGAPGGQSTYGITGKIYAGFSSSVTTPRSLYKESLPLKGTRRMPLSFGANGAFSPPDARAWLSWGEPMDSAPPGTLPVTTELSRTRDNITPPDGMSDFMLGRVSWKIESADPTVTWTGSRLTLRYTSAEVAGLVESSIRIAHAPTLEGPWTQPGNQVVSVAANEIACDMPGPGCFVLLATLQPPSLLGMSLQDLDGLNDPSPGYTNSATVAVSVTTSGTSDSPPTALELSEASDFGKLIRIEPGQPLVYTFSNATDDVKTLYGRLNQEGAISNVRSASITLDTRATRPTAVPLSTKDHTPRIAATMSATGSLRRVNAIVEGLEYVALETGSEWAVPDNSIPYLPDGKYSVTWVTFDGAGNSASSQCTGCLVIDNVPPVTTVTSQETKDTRPALSGTITDGDGIASVTVLLAGGTYGVTPPGSSGIWSLPRQKVTPELEDGVYDVVVISTDRAGNTSLDTTKDELVIDTTPPKVVVHQRITNEHNVALSGEIEDARQIAYVMANYSNIFWFPVYTNNEWSINDHGMSLPDGTYDILVTASDRAGNIGTDTTTSDLIIDSVAPTCDIISAPAWSVDEDVTITLQVTNPSAGAVTELGTPRLYARTERGTWQATDAACSGDTFRWRPNLGSGRYFLQSVLSDAAGNSTPVPAGEDGAGQATIVYNDRQNGALTLSVGAGSSSYFPMSATAGVLVDFAAATEDSDVTVAREVPPAQVPPDLDPALVIPEALVISGSLAGTASLVWSTDFAADPGLPAPLDTVFQAKPGLTTVPHAVTVEANDLRVEGITGFSTWYAGSRTALATSAWMLY